METELLKVQDLTFELNFPEDSDGVPLLEVENNTSAVLVRFDISQATALRDLLTRYIEAYHAK